MTIRIRAAGDHAEDQLRSLHRWLLDDPELRRNAAIKLTGEPAAPGRMGGALDVITLIVDSGFQALSLALAYAAWRSTRPDKPQITVERDGTKITVPADDPEAVEKIVRMLGEKPG